MLNRASLPSHTVPALVPKSLLKAVSLVIISSYRLSWLWESKAAFNAFPCSAERTLLVPPLVRLLTISEILSFFPSSVAIVVAKLGSLLRAFANSISVSRASGAPATSASTAAFTFASTPETALLAANAAALASSVAFFANPVCITDASLAAFASSVAFFAKAV